MLRKENIAYFFLLVAVIAASAGYVYLRDLPACYNLLQKSEQQVDVLKKEREATQQERHRLKRRVEYLGTDRVEQEAAIRKNNLVRKGEVVYRIELPPENLPAKQEPTSNSDTRNPST